MWRFRYKNIFKTSNPELIITACTPDFPNTTLTLEDYKKEINSERLQSDRDYLELMGEYYNRNGEEFIPLYFKDDCPKLKKFPVQYTDKFHKMYWCIGYRTTNYVRTSEFSSKYTSPSLDWFLSKLEYWVTNFDYEYSSVTKYLVNSIILIHIYNNTQNLSDELKGRRFDLIENKRLVYEFKCKEDYLNFYNNIKDINIYELIFKYFR